eukprot:jgi/Botrbrau1/19112/Bobra.0077s0025.1
MRQTYLRISSCCEAWRWPCRQPPQARDSEDFIRQTSSASRYRLSWARARQTQRLRPSSRPWRPAASRTRSRTWACPWTLPRYLRLQAHSQPHLCRQPRRDPQLRVMNPLRHRRSLPPRPPSPQGYPLPHRASICSLPALPQWRRQSRA